MAFLKADGKYFSISIGWIQVNSNQTKSIESQWKATHIFFLLFFVLFFLFTSISIITFYFFSLLPNLYSCAFMIDYNKIDWKDYNLMMIAWKMTMVHAAWKKKEIRKTLNEKKGEPITHPLSTCTYSGFRFQNRIKSLYFWFVKIIPMFVVSCYTHSFFFSMAILENIYIYGLVGY